MWQGNTIQEPINAQTQQEVIHIMEDTRNPLIIQRFFDYEMLIGKQQKYQYIIVIVTHDSKLHLLFYPSEFLVKGSIAWFAPNGNKARSPWTYGGVSVLHKYPGTCLSHSVPILEETTHAYSFSLIWPLLLDKYRT